MFEFALSPLERTTLAVESTTEFLTDTGVHAYETKFEGVTSELGETDNAEPDNEIVPEDDISDEDPNDESDPGEDGDGGTIPDANDPAGDNQ